MSNRLYETRVLRRVSQYVIGLKEEKKKIAKALGVKVQDIFPEEADDNNGR